MKLAELKPVVVLLLCCVLLPAHAQVQNANTGELDGLRPHATNLFRNPKQPWPGYGIYLGRGLVITAAHVVGRVGLANPSVGIAGQRPFQPVEDKVTSRGGFDAAANRSVRASGADRIGCRAALRGPACRRRGRGHGDAGNCCSTRILSPEMLPAEIRGRFGTIIADVATTGNSGSGVFDTAKNRSLLGILSRKIQERTIVGTNGMSVEKLVDLAKYFVPRSSDLAVHRLGARIRPSLGGPLRSVPSQRRWSGQPATNPAPLRESSPARAFLAICVKLKIEFC